MNRSYLHHPKLPELTREQVSEQTVNAMRVAIALAPDRKEMALIAKDIRFYFDKCNLLTQAQRDELAALYVRKYNSFSGAIDNDH